MRVERIVGPRYVAPFPVYSDVVGDLLAPNVGDEPNPTVAHVLATCASYCYADLDTVALIMTRLGMDGCGVVRVEQAVEAMYIYSTAFLVQSRCGRVVILCYRGTEPTNLASWLGDADVGAEPLRVASANESDALEVHRGFYRNFRATHWQVLQELALALKGRRLGDPNETAEHPLEALYVTGHSLGGAMAVLFALTTAYEQLRSVYTFGQPMVVRGPLPVSAEAMGRKIFRHVLARDPVPALPPATWGTYVHFGKEYQHSPSGWELATEPTVPMSSLREIRRSVLAFLNVGSRRESTRYAIDAHPPHRYLDSLRPAGRVTEFGD
jgi:Lipase (class 3)